MQETLQETQRFREMAKNDGVRGLALDLTIETFEQFPYAVLEIPELRVLTLNFNNLSSIPPTINRLINLEVLELRANDFKEFPSSLCELSHLEILDLSDNEICTIPSEIGTLTALKTLKLQNTKLKGCLSEHLSTLTSLVHLDVSRNSLDFLPESLTNIKGLERLDIRRNALVEAPSMLAMLTKLKTLDISYNKLEAFDLDLSKLKQLEDLDLEGNRLKSFPEKICSLVNLKRLDVGRNKIPSIPVEIKKLYKLKRLWLNHNELSSFPNVICQMKLETLSVSYNNIKSVPGDMAFMKDMKNLELDGCGLDTIPFAICMLKNVKWLSLGDNNIKKIPIVLTSWHELLYINLEGNKDLKIPPPSILRRGIKGIFNYLLEAEIKKVIYQKVIFLGNVRAGKSSLSKTLIQGSSQLSNDRDRTVVLDEMTWTPEENLRMQVYDFGGSAWYDVVQHFFIDKHSIVFLVVSLTDYRDEAYVESVEKWLQIIQARAPGACLFVVATHTDLLKEDEVAAKRESILDTMHSRERNQVENVEKEIKRLEELGNEAKTACESLKKSLRNRLVLPDKVYSVSSKTLQNLAELKKDLLEKAKELGRVIPSSWQELYHSLHTSELSKTKQFLNYKDVVQLDNETAKRCQATFAYSPGITRRSPIDTQTSEIHARTTSFSTKKEHARRKTSEHTCPPPEAFRNSRPTEHDEPNASLPRSRFQIQRLDERPECPLSSVDPLASRDYRLHDILTFFHSIGDVVWYEGNPEVKNFVFHKQSFLIELLKRIFSERPCELHMKPCVMIRQGLSSKALDAAREDLRTRGIMSLIFLKALLDDMKLNNKIIEAIMKLLVHFDLCFEMQDEVQTKLHFPWFLSESVPNDASAILEHPPAKENWRFILEYDFPLNCPPALYDSMAVHTHREVPDSGSIEQWKNGVYARIRDSKVMLHRTFDELQMSTIKFYVEGQDVNHLWRILGNLHKEFRILMISWPGIMLEMWLVCPHCTREGLLKPHRFEGENIERCCPENEEMFTCPNANGTIPANLIFPVQAPREVPSDEELSKIAHFVCKDWRLLGRALGLQENELDGVDGNYVDIYEKAYQMLQTWKRSRGSKAHCALLIKALESDELKRNDVVEKIVNRWMRPRDY